MTTKPVTTEPATTPAAPTEGDIVAGRDRDVGSAADPTRVNRSAPQTRHELEGVSVRLMAVWTQVAAASEGNPQVCLEALQQAGRQRDAIQASSSSAE